MKRRRNKLDVYADILKVTLNGARKTHIVGKANLNFRLIQPYLETLIARGLMFKTRKPFQRRYMFWTTPKGIEFLGHYRSLNQAIEDIDK